MGMKRNYEQIQKNARGVGDESSPGRKRLFTRVLETYGDEMPQKTAEIGYFPSLLCWSIREHTFDTRRRAGEEPTRSRHS